MPLLWHWLAFTTRAQQADLGPDGHQRTGSFLPPRPGRRRVFAGATVTRHGWICADEPLEQLSRVTSAQQKAARFGQMTFITVRRVVTGPAGSVEEVDTIDYREPSGALPPHEPETTNWRWRKRVDIDPTLLFRFSALTYNAHRIHYDRIYATDVESYPGLVVHGPLQAILLADLAERKTSRAGASITFRATAPAFDNSALEVCATPAGDHMNLVALSDGIATMGAAIPTQEHS